MNVTFLTSGHDPFDDRIYYHMARSLNDNNHTVSIISSRHEMDEISEGISMNCFEGSNLPKREKIKHFTSRLKITKPAIVICCEPLTILAARHYKKQQNRKLRIVSDITEWYPSKKNVYGIKYPFRILVFMRLLIFNLWVTRFADSFIFGEWYKSRPYRFLYPGKPFIFTSYYPDLRYIPCNDPSLKRDLLRLTYSGKISHEKGYANFIKVIHTLSELRPGLKIELKIIGWYENEKDRSECESLSETLKPGISTIFSGKQSFKNFIDLIKDTDIFIDLRFADFENQLCLPIKLFYYTALGRPVIFSDLKAIRKEVEYSEFGFLVKPEDSKSIANIISDYLDNEKLYHSHCMNARLLAVNKYNWGKIETNFVKFISSK